MANGPTDVSRSEAAAWMAGAISCAATPPLRLWIRLNAAGRKSTIQLDSEKRSEKCSVADQTFQNDFSSKISPYKTPF